MSDNEPNPVGRPLRYYEENINERSIEYITTFKDIVLGNATSAVVPSIAGLSLYLKVSRETIYAWGEKYDEFSDTLGFLRATQEHELVNNGLNGLFSGVIARLMLANHGYHEKQDINNTGETKTQVVYIEAKEKNGLESHINSIVEDAD